MLRRDARLQFLQALTASRIRYLLLSNFDLEGDVSVCGDMDICVPTSEQEQFIVLIANYGFYERRKPSEVPGHYFYISHDASLGFYLDVQYELEFVDVKAGRTFFLEKTFEQFWLDSYLKDGFYCPVPYDQFLLYLAKCAWQKQKLDERSLKFLVQLGAAAQYAEQTESILGIDFGFQSESSGVEEILSAFEREVSFGSTDLPKKKSNGSRGGPPELFVLFLGPDGVGKSSIINGVKSMSPIKCKPLYLGLGEDGWRVPFVKRFRKIKSKIANKLGFEYLFWFFLFPLELLIRHFTAKRSGGWCIHLVDRFPGRPFIRGGMWERLYRMVLPKPDLIVLLTGDPVVIAGRKPTETSVTRTVKEFKKWSLVAKKINCPVFGVDTTANDIEKCSQLVLQEIMKVNKYQIDFFLDVKRQG
jgi:hypothetical protein